MLKNSLTSANYGDYIPQPGETKSSRYKFTKSFLDDHVNKILDISIQSETDSDDIQGQGVKITSPSNITDS